MVTLNKRVLVVCVLCLFMKTVAAVEISPWGEASLQSFNILNDQPGTDTIATLTIGGVSADFKVVSAEQKIIAVEPEPDMADGNGMVSLGDIIILLILLLSLSRTPYNSRQPL